MPTKPYSEFLRYLMECMTFLPGLRARAMFGGYGLYQDDLIFAIVVNDVLYLKADVHTRQAFNGKNLPPFTYKAKGKTIALQYYEAPPEVFEQPEAMQEWVQKALAVALKAKQLNCPGRSSQPATRQRSA
jgi:DNA transformation protein and related proteins